MCYPEERWKDKERGRASVGEKEKGTGVLEEVTEYVKREI